jgi:hypothetical protein
MSPPGWCLRSRTNPTSRPSTTVGLAHFWSSGVDVATYFSTPLMNVANGSIWLLGQNCAAYLLWMFVLSGALLLTQGARADQAEGGRQEQLATC